MRGRARVAAAALPLLLAVACGGGSGGTHAAPPPPRAASGSPLDLQGVCPAAISVQTAATARVEQGALYRLLGAGASVETGEKRAAGELVASGRDTGVRLEIRAGAAGGGAQVPALLYADTSLTLGIVSTDEAVLDWRDHPTLAVMAPLDIDPTAILWSPEKHPDWASIADVGKAGGTVLSAAGAASIEYLLASGVLRRSQVDPTYDGTPARFVASGGAIAQQGRVTDEPFVYSRELPAWNRQVRFQLVHETGYPAYADAVVIRPPDRTRLAPCLQRLVPILQRSAVTYAGNPRPADAAIVTLAHDLGAAPAYTAARAAFAADELRKLGVVGNGSNSTIGDLDAARVQRVVDVLVKAGRAAAPGPRAQDLVTNEFIDPAVGL